MGYHQMAGWTHCVGLLGISQVGIWGCTRYFPSMPIRQFEGIQHIPRLSDLFVVTCEYGLMDIDVVVTGRAFDFQEALKLSIDFPLCFRDNQEWFSDEFRVWRDTRDPNVVFDLSSPVSAEVPLLTNVLRDNTLEFEIRVERALMDLKES